MCSLGFLSACSDDVTGNESTTPNVFTDIFLTDVGKTAVKSSNEFAFTMINHFMEEAFEYSDPDNVCVSPYSLYFVLAMLVNGSEDVGQEKMLNLMGDVNKDELSTFNAAYSKLTSTLTHFDSKVNLGIANSLWHNKGQNVTPGFRSIMDTYYNGDIYSSDLYSEEGKNRLNQWSSDRTNGMIEKIYEVPPYMDVVLANAVYFKACWKKPFKIENTKSWKFKNFNSSEGDVMMMLVSDQGTTIPYAEIEGTEMVTLPFSAGNFVMDLILPSKTEDFRNLTQRLSDGFFGDLLNGQQERKKEAIDLSVRFPRFEINGDMSLAKLVLSQLNILHWNFPE